MMKSRLKKKSYRRISCELKLNNQIEILSCDTLASNTVQSENSQLINTNHGAEFGDVQS